MADTFLNTGNTGMATSNVQANINQTNGQNVTNNPNINNTNGVQNANTQAVNPITIPIQIQPQIAGQNQLGNGLQQNVQPNQNLQVGNNQQTQGYNSPTPQNYNNTNANNNVVDFNQIYNSYNQALGRNTQNNNFNSGIKKSSYNTTIVTPTTNNLNTIQGKYQSAYSDTVNGVISSMLTQVEKLRTGDIGYDPTQDTSLRMASEYAANSTLQSLAGSGVLNSSATAERVARIVSELIPQYEEKAYNRQVQYLSQLADTAQLVMNFDNQQFEYWKDAKDREFKDKEFEFNKQQKSLENAWRRVDELGFVDNEASTVLGVKVGTLSSEARLAKEQREFELEKMQKELEIQHANNVALTKLKTELETDQQKELARYNSVLEKEIYKYKNQLDIMKNKELASYNDTLDRNSYKYKSDIDATKNKDLANYNAMLEKELEGYKSDLSTKQSKELASYEDVLKRGLMQYESQLNTAQSKDLANYNSSLEKDMANYKSKLSTEQSKELASYNNALDMAMAQYNSKLSTEQSKELASYNSALDRSKMAYQNELNTQSSKDLANYNAMLERELAGYKNQLAIAQNKELANYNNSLEKDLAGYKNNLTQNNMDLEYQLAQKYGTNSSKTNNTTSLSTYRDIINNRFANYDEFSKKYTVSDNASLYNYLVTEYSAGRMSASDLANLTAMYNVTQPTDSEIARSERIKYLNSLGV